MNRILFYCMTINESDFRRAVWAAALFLALVCAIRSHMERSRGRRSDPADEQSDSTKRARRGVKGWWRSLSGPRKVAVVIAGTGLIGLTIALAAGVGVGLLGVTVSMVGLAVTTLTVAADSRS